MCRMLMTSEAWYGAERYIILKPGTVRLIKPGTVRLIKPGTVRVLYSMVRCEFYIAWYGASFI